MSDILARFFAHLIALTSEELRDLVFRKRALLGLLFYAGAVATFVVLLASVDQLTLPFALLFNAQGGQFRDVIDQAAQYGFGDELQLFSQVSSWPAPVLVLQLVSLMWFPSLVSLISCDMISIDLYRGTLRYLVGRTTRSIYFFSKLLAHTSLYAILQLVTLAALYLAASQRARFDSVLYLHTISRCFLIFLPFLFFVVTTTAFVSCLSSRPMNAILRLHLLWIAFISLLFIDARLSPLNKAVMLPLMAPVGPAAIRGTMLLSLWALGFGVAGLWLIRVRRL